MSSAAAIKSHSMKSPKFQKRLNPLKNPNFGMGIVPPTSPEFHTDLNESLSQQETEKIAGRTDFGNVPALDKSSSSSFTPETRHETKADFIEREKARLSAEGNKTVQSLSEKDQKYLQSVKDRLNLLTGEKNGQKENLKFPGNKAKDFPALRNKHDLRSSFYQDTVNKQETISNHDGISTFIAKKSLEQTLDATQTEKETSQDNHFKLATCSLISHDESSYESSQVSKKNKKTKHIPSPVLNEVKSEDNLGTDSDFKKANGETIDNSFVDKDEGSQVKLEKAKLSSYQGKSVNLKKKALKKKLVGLNPPDVQDLLKPLPSQRHKQYFDPQEIAERRRQKLLEKMNQKKILFDEASPTQQPLFQDYGWLAKYCIFNNDNWTIYGRTFESADTKNRGWLTPKETMMALRTANSQLTPSEEEYLCRIIELTGYSIDDGSDLRLFSILAALSHRITSLE
ncbi:unnamed protein product [Acanthosepion pharaonis]|uniref:Uncharacterized protein n=1 Tax=Acanthosepion pharaonis TaxID=158019 RepID=A0A812BUL7_ACAPH|nr:unnamed protein product [Sepia pharaonis]